MQLVTWLYCESTSCGLISDTSLPVFSTVLLEAFFRLRCFEQQQQYLYRALVLACLNGFLELDVPQSSGKEKAYCTTPCADAYLLTFCQVLSSCKHEWDELVRVES